jgi:rubrerythrin
MRKERKQFIRKQIADEKKAAVMYERRGFPQIARDERRHLRILTKKLKG